MCLKLFILIRCVVCCAVFSSYTTAVVTRARDESFNRHGRYTIISHCNREKK